MVHGITPAISNNSSVRICSLAHEIITAHYKLYIARPALGSRARPTHLVPQAALPCQIQCPLCMSYRCQSEGMQAQVIWSVCYTVLSIYGCYP